MNTRRKFLLNGSMATTALLTAKPFTALANTLAPITGYSINNNKVVLVHTGNHNSMDQLQTANQVSTLKNNTGNLVLLHAGDHVHESSSHLNYDAVIHSNDRTSLSTNEYNIIYKGNIKIGVITATGYETDMVSRINTVSAYLKKEKNCHLVVCLSQLGYRSKSKLDDITLAERSANLDIIIGGHDNNFCKQPVIALNKHKEEIIINHAADHSLAVRKIEIEFDDFGKKKHIAFTRTVQSAHVS